VRATEIAAALGQAVAVLLGLVGLFGNPVLLFIALFVWLGAKAEATTAQLEGALEGIPVGYAAARDVRTVAPDDPIDAAVVHALAGFQHDFPVIDHDGRVVGLLPHHTLLTALDQRGTNVRVASVMERDPAIVHPLELLDRILPRLQQAPGRCLVVVDDRGVLVGLVTVSTVGELVAIRDALHGRRTAALPSGSPSPLRAARA
jgi:CBS domain-containing protein